MKRNNGFTLAELLIVVAIIAVLVGISIPVFTAQLEKSREATDLANVRAAYAEVMLAAIEENKSVTLSTDGIVIYKEDEDVYSASVNLKQKLDGWSSKLSLTVGGVTSASVGSGDNGDDWLNSPQSLGVCEIKFSLSQNKVIIDWSGNAILAKEGFSVDDFLGHVPATWKGAGGMKNSDASSSWYNQSRSTNKLVKLEPNSEYIISYTIEKGYSGSTIQLGTLLFKNENATDDISKDTLSNGQKADSGWISSTTNNNANTSNYQTIVVNPDGSKTITQKITTDETHIYFGANCYTGKDLLTNEKDKIGVENAINSLMIKKN